VSFASAAGGGLDMVRSWRPTVASRGQLFAVVGCVAAVNGFAGKIATAIYSQPLAVAILDLGGVSAIVWFAIGILFVLASDTATPSPAVRPADKAVFGLTLVLSFIPLNFAAAIGLLLCGAYLALCSPGGSAERRIALVLLALTGPLIWGRFLLALIGPFLLRIDAALAGLLAGARVQGNVVSLAGGQGNLYVALGCSSVHNMSLAVLLFVAVTQALRLRFTPLLLLTGAGAALMMATVNVMRLATLARFPEHFELFHTGWGGSLFGAVSFIAAGAIIAWGAHAELAR
jgi:exosortase/archaeosortase family protein